MQDPKLDEKEHPGRTCKERGKERKRLRGRARKDKQKTELVVLEL